MCVLAIPRDLLAQGIIYIIDAVGTNEIDPSSRQSGASRDLGTIKHARTHGENSTTYIERPDHLQSRSRPSPALHQVNVNQALHASSRDRRIPQAWFILSVGECHHRDECNEDCRYWLANKFHLPRVAHCILPSQGTLVPC